MRSIVTVVTEAESQDLTTLSTVKRELGIPLTDDSKDLLLSSYIRQASGVVSAYCRRDFGLETVSESFRPSYAVGAIMLSRRPVVEVTSVTENTSSLTSTEYELDKKTGFLYRLNSDVIADWATGSITVVYQAGYLLIDGLPYPVERATVLLVKQYYYSNAKDPLLRSEDIPGVMSQSFWVGAPGDNGALPPEVKHLLELVRDYSAA